MSVSYLISSYNKAEYLIAVLKSVANEFAATGGEIFIIDDGSTDASWNVIQSFCEQDSRFSAKRQDNRGIFNVTNQLIRAATQKWLRIIDCDDPPISGSTSMLIKLAEKNEVGYLFGTTLPYGPEPLSTEQFMFCQQEPAQLTILSDPLRYAIRDYNHVPTTALIRRDCVPATTKLNETLISCQDLALALTVFERTRVASIDSAVCHQLVRSNKRLSSNEALTYFQTIQIIKEFGASKFDERYKYMSARKIVSRALKWMRHEHMICELPILYAKLLFLYGKLLVSAPIRWERYLDSAASAYIGLIPSDRRIY